MHKCFVFTASNPDAQLHLRDSIDNPVKDELVLRHLEKSLVEFLRIQSPEGVYAWGAVPGDNNIRNWNAMEEGDTVLVYYRKAYHYVSHVIAKVRNRSFALDLWGTDNEGKTWEYVYFIKKPIKLEAPVPSESLSEHLPASFQGFAKITDDRIARIEKEYGDFETFLVNRVLSNNQRGALIYDVDEILKWEECQKVINSKEFYFEKARDAFRDFVEFKETDDFYDKVLHEYNSSDLSYPDFIEQYSHLSREFKFFIIAGKLIAYMDTHGANKKVWNLYEDKRVLARAGIYQSPWINNLIRYKRAGNDLNVVSPGVRNALIYFVQPREALTIVSEEHKSLISEKILLKEYDPATFTADVLSYFSQYNIAVANEDNRTRLYSHILYHPKVAEIWKDSIRGLVAIDPNQDWWMDKLIKDLQNKEYGVVWWSKSPTGTGQTLAKLKKKLKEDKSFELYYIVDGLVQYRATVTDFATAEDYEGKNWNFNDDVALYQESFSDYTSNNQTAAIVFLVEKFEKLDNPFSVEQFEWHGNYTAPRRDNLQPFQDILITDPGDDPEEPIAVPTTESLSFTDKQREVLMAIKTKPFVLLAGISGTGKSRLVRTLAYKTCTHPELKATSKPGNFEMIKVKPNWHDSMELLGYESRISGSLEYVVTDFLRFLVKAWQYLDVPFFLCLDEMNLAPVEQYFAEYLSVLETRRFYENGMASDAFLSALQIKDYSTRDKEFFAKLGIENKPQLQQQFLSQGLTLPSNLVVMGTVNMDETTHSFSRKVLDRAMTIEMNEVDLGEALTTRSDDWVYPAIPYNKQFVLGSLLEGNDAHARFTEGDYIVGLLKRINQELEGSTFKIAYRVRDEVLIYCYHNSTLDELPADWLAKALDEAILVKVLSRIEGDESKVKKPIEGLLGILTEAEYPRCHKKLREMNERMLFGYTSFWV